MGQAVPDVTRIDGVAQLMRAPAGDRTQLQFAEVAVADRTTVGRWLSGATEPKLPELLRILGGTTHRLLDFVGLFADPARLASTGAAYGDLLAQRRLAYEMPWSHAVLRALELQEYLESPQHEPGFVAVQVGLPTSEEDRHLEALERAGQIRRHASHFVPTRVLTVDTRPSEEENHRLKCHWADVARERLADGSAGATAMFSYNLFAVDAADVERIRRPHLEFYERVREIIGACEAPDRVVLINQQLVPLRRVPKGSAQ